MKYGQRITQVFHPANPDPNCLCGFTKCDRENPYCEVSRLAERAVVSSKAAGGPGLSESDALLQAFDRMAEWHRAEAKRKAGGEDGREAAKSGQAHTTPATGKAGKPPVNSPSPRVPSKKELKRRALDREARATEPMFLLEEDPAVEAILRGPREED